NLLLESSLLHVLLHLRSLFLFVTPLRRDHGVLGLGEIVSILELEGGTENQQLVDLLSLLFNLFLFFFYNLLDLLSLFFFHFFHLLLFVLGTEKISTVISDSLRTSSLSCQRIHYSN
ncbi:hypothetical protein PFISCL1PPCAC_26888, partial [Pristionchus fissidentatus]